MTDQSHIPDDLDDFLYWLKDQTEAAWATYQTKTFEEFEDDGVGGSSWRVGTRWQKGLAGSEIDALEQRWKLRFPIDYRRFLEVLNAPDRGAYSVGWSDDPPYGMEEGDDEPSYFDWQKDDEALLDALNWPLEGLLFDVENNDLWPDSWGAQPGNKQAIGEKLAQLVAAAPSLIPITGHRYLLAGSGQASNPVLSVWQSDIICYGATLRNFLLLEFSGLLGHDDPELFAKANHGMSEETIATIPFWGGLILGNDS